MAHITGGGFDENIPRVLPDGCQAVIDEESFPIPPIFTYLQKLGHLKKREMYNVFNMGIGMVIVIRKNQLKKALETLKQAGADPYVIGYITRGEGVQLK